jgi:PAS domain-containing protein
MAEYDEFPGPVYAVGVSGHLIYHNVACQDISGRAPQVGTDRWCVAAAVLTLDGTAVDFHTGPMASTVRDGVPLRDLDALMAHPDGKRVAVRFFPTPAIDALGKIVGAINLLIPHDGVIRRRLLDTARRCKSLGRWIDDRQASAALTAMADECERHAKVLTIA